MGIRDTGGTHCLKPWISCETGAAAFYIRSNLFLLPDRIHNIEGGGSITSSSEPSPCHRQRRGSIHGTHLLSGRWRIEVLGIRCHGVGRPVRFTPVPESPRARLSKVRTVATCPPVQRSKTLQVPVPAVADLWPEYWRHPCSSPYTRIFTSSQLTEQAIATASPSRKPFAPQQFMRYLPFQSFI